MTRGSARIRVLVVDDQPRTADALARRDAGIELVPVGGEAQERAGPNRHARSWREARVPTCTSRPRRPISSFACHDQVPKQYRTPSRSSSRSVCASTWTMPRSRRTPASAFTTGHAQEWSPPSASTFTPGFTDSTSASACSAMESGETASASAAWAGRSG